MILLKDVLVDATEHHSDLAPLIGLPANCFESPHIAGEQREKGHQVVPLLVFHLEAGEKNVELVGVEHFMLVYSELD